MAPDKPAKLAAILALLSSDKPGEAQTPTGSFDIFRDWPTRWRAAVYVCQSAPQTWLTPFERQFVGNVIAKGGAK
jgi:hypothetical protein